MLALQNGVAEFKKVVIGRHNCRATEQVTTDMQILCMGILSTLPFENGLSLNCGNLYNTFPPAVQSALSFDCNILLSFLSCASQLMWKNERAGRRKRGRVWISAMSSLSLQFVPCDATLLPLLPFFPRRSTTGNVDLFKGILAAARCDRRLIVQS